MEDCQETPGASGIALDIDVTCLAVLNPGILLEALQLPTPSQQCSKYQWRPKKSSVSQIEHDMIELYRIEGFGHIERN